MYCASGVHFFLVFGGLSWRSLPWLIIWHMEVYPDFSLLSRQNRLFKLLVLRTEASLEHGISLQFLAYWLCI